MRSRGVIPVCLLLVFGGLVFATAPAVADDTCVEGNLVCVVDREYGSRPCGDGPEYKVTGVKALGGQASVTHTQRCSDAETYHQESHNVRVDLDVAKATVQVGNGSTDAYGDNELVWADVTVGSYQTGAFFVEVYRYRNDVRDECRVTVSSTFTGEVHEADCTLPA